MTAQHAIRQGRTAARNIAASHEHSTRRPSKHRDLGFAVGLGGSRPRPTCWMVPLSGPAAKSVTRGYHLLAMPCNHVRSGSDWLLDALLPRQAIQLGLVRAPAAPLEDTAPDIPAVPPRGGGPGLTGCGRSTPAPGAKRGRRSGVRMATEGGHTREPTDGWTGAVLGGPPPWVVRFLRRCVRRVRRLRGRGR